MNRFFSKLDLRDIKISPEGSRFPPDADDYEEPAEEAKPVSGETDTAASTTRSDQAEETTTPEHRGVVVESQTIEFEYHKTTRVWDASSVEKTEEVHASGYGHVETRNGEVVTPAYKGYIGEAGTDLELAAVLGEVLKVSARSRPSAVAGAIAGVVRECGRAEVQAIGAGATNQAVKAVAIARDYLRETGIDAVCLPAFIDVTIENEDRTAIRLVVETR